MQSYLKHHLEVAWITEELFCNKAILLVHQQKGQPPCTSLQGGWPWHSLIASNEVRNVIK